MTGRDFISCAKRLVQYPEEAELRSAVSRAYYGAFHEARSLLRECGIRMPKTEQVHVKIVYCLEDCGDPFAESAGRLLDNLRDLRKVADYELGDTRFASREKVEAEVAKAGRIIGYLDTLQTSNDFRSKVRAQAKLLGLPVSD